MIVKGKLAPVVGAVSMDLTTIDVTGCADLKTGDAVMLLGSEGGVSINAQQMAKWAGTISYAVLCGIHAGSSGFISIKLNLACFPDCLFRRRLF